MLDLDEFRLAAFISGIIIITLFTIRIGVEMSSHCGSMVANLTSIHEDLRLIPGLA